MSLLEFCARTLPRPQHVLALRRTITAALVGLAVLTVAAAIAPDALLRVDQPVSNWFRDLGGADAWRRVSLLGATEVYVPLAVVASAMLWRRCRSLAVVWPALITIGVVVNLVTKVIVGRPRPLNADTGTALASFPSGHAIHATVVLGLIPPTLYVLTRRTVSVWISAPLLLGMAVLTGASRVALGGHWPTDVIAGHLIGFALLIAADLVIELHHDRAAPRIENLHPARWPAPRSHPTSASVATLRRAISARDVDQ